MKLYLQSTFISERLITDNVLVTYEEMIHFLQSKSQGPESFRLKK
jgi:hypothetical protein